MNVDIGTEAAQFPEKEYMNGIFATVSPLVIKQPSEHCPLRILPHDISAGKRQFEARIYRINTCLDFVEEILSDALCLDKVSNR
jgi:hypothetical protein